MASSQSRLVEVLFKFSLVSHFTSELEINIKFPTCWDGVNAEDSNGNHVAYSLECDGLENDGPNECYDFDCPETHPVKVSVISKVATSVSISSQESNPIQIPEIHLYVRILDYEGGAHVFSNDTDVRTIKFCKCVV